MSKIIWSASLLPNELKPRTIEYDIFEPILKIDQALPIETPECDFEIPDKKALRLMSRTSVLLSAVLLKGEKVISRCLEKDPFRVATYCAIENGADSYKGAKSLLDIDVKNEDFAKRYRRSRSPKSYLKQLPNLAPAQAGIFLGLVGPLNVYQNSKWGGLHALEQMESDFANNMIDTAIICTANSFEDALLTLKNSKMRKHGTILTEGSGALVITSEGSSQNWKEILFLQKNEHDFGISTGIMGLIKK